MPSSVSTVTIESPGLTRSDSRVRCAVRQRDVKHMQFAVCRQNLPLRAKSAHSYLPNRFSPGSACVYCPREYRRRVPSLSRRGARSCTRNFLASAAFTDIFADQIHHLRETDKLRPFCRRLVNPGACRLQILSFIILCIHLHQCHCISAYHKYPLYPVYKRFSLHNYLYFIIASLFHTGQPMQGTYARTVTRLFISAYYKVRMFQGA